MKIALTTSRGGDGWTQEPGDVLEVGIEINPIEAQRLLLCGQAVAVDSSRESAAIDPPRNAMNAHASKRKKGKRNGIHV